MATTPTPDPGPASATGGTEAAEAAEAADVADAADVATIVAVRELLTDLLELGPDPDWSTVNADALDDWDSLVHMAIVDEVESALGRELVPAELTGLTSYAAILAILRA